MWILCPGPVIHWHCSQAPPPPCQFRMQFPSGIALVRIGLRRCVTCVFELHAKFVWARPCRRPPHGWGLCSLWVPLLFGTAARPRRYSAISHVIPLRLLQILNSCRWNCNLFGWSQKMTEGNYVRNLSGPGAAAAHRHRSRAPTSPCQFRMQFPSCIALVRIGLRRCVTCVFELHAKFVWTMPCRCPPHRWDLCSIWAPLLFGTAVGPA